jgi:poly(3-hydroxybutyrate) depolymerase
MDKRTIAFILAVSVLFLLVGCGTTASAISQVSEPDENGYITCDYNGVIRKFVLYVPEVIEENTPLVFMLHGYSGNSKSFMNDTGMNSEAEKFGFAVVYPQGIPDKANSTGGACWNSGLTNAANDDTGFLVALAEFLQQTYGFNSASTFAAGFSNGAFMMYKLAVTAPETFRTVASVSGAMSGGAWDERKTSTSVGILQINGTEDSVVPIDKDGVYGDAPAIGGVIDYWRNANNLDESEEVKLSDKATAYCYSSRKNDNLVWYVEIEGGGHSWPEEDTAGLNANELILEYFNNYVN